MLATPNSVRGLDVRGLTHVYTLYLPMHDAREYVHLAGRVGRVGQAPPNSSGANSGGGNVISVLRKGEAHLMDDLASQLGFEFSDIDMDAIRGPSFSEILDKEHGETGGEGDLESMRRYLEDTLNLLSLNDDPGRMEVETISSLNDDEDDEDKEEPFL